MIPRGLALLLCALGCSSPEKPAADVAPAPSAAPAVTKAPEAPQSTEAERRARYESRPTVSLPRDTPGAWGRFVERTGGRLTEARHEVRTRKDTGGVARSIELELRLFGADAEVDAKLLAALAALELPGLDDALPTEPVTEGDVVWSVKTRRYKAPEGSAREAIATLRWARAPPPPAEEIRCRKSPPVDAPAEAPKWLEQQTNARSTRRRVTAAVRTSAEGTAATMRMLFRNGWAHDETVGKWTAAAKRQGFEKVSGSGPKQRWRHPKSKAELSWRSDNSELGLGCKLEGPVLEVTVAR